MGESFGPWKMGADEEVMPHITSANVACGAHAGDPVVMRRTVKLARAAGVAVGAHPGFADLQGFGRREMQADPAEIEDAVIAQIGACAAIARAEGAPLQHVKAHGALYNMAARDPKLAAAIARAIRRLRPVADHVRPARTRRCSTPAAAKDCASPPRGSPTAATSRTGR